MAFPLSDDEHRSIRNRIDGQDELIVAAAIRVPFGARFINLTVERPGRHGDLIYAAGLISGDRMAGGEHGFITNRGRFVDRRAAGDIVHLSEQGTTRHGCNGNLFSEDMWKEGTLRCTAHPERVSRVNLDGDELCQECADAWVRGEGAAAAARDLDGEEFG